MEWLPPWRVILRTVMADTPSVLQTTPARPAMRSSGKDAVLLYDGQCRMCRDIVAYARRNGFMHGVETISYHDLPAEEEGLKRWAERGVVLMVPDVAEPLRGVDAIAALARIQGCTVLGRLLLLPGIHAAAKVAYRFVAAVRRGL